MENKKPKLTLITYHYLESKRKAGFHHLAKAFYELGYEVLFFTAPISWLSVIDRNFRCRYPVMKEAGRMIKKNSGIWSYVHFTPFHIVGFKNKVINSLIAPFCYLYDKFKFSEAAPFIKESEIIIFESTSALFLFDKIKRVNPEAKLVYRVSDLLETLRSHPKLLELERKISSKFDLVSVPSEYMYNKFSELGNIKLQIHGVNRELLDKDYTNPYKGDSANLVFSGSAYLDVQFLSAASLVDMNLKFHIIGKVSNAVKSDKIIYYGEMDFEKTIPYIKYADVGLQCLSFRKEAESFSDSHKIIQYSYYGLPIIAPDFLRSSRSNVFYYVPRDHSSIKAAICSALEYKKDYTLREGILSWKEMAQEMIGSLYS